MTSVHVCVDMRARAAACCMLSSLRDDLASRNDEVDVAVLPADVEGRVAWPCTCLSHTRSHGSNKFPTGVFADRHDRVAYATRARGCFTAGPSP